MPKNRLANVNYIFAIVSCKYVIVDCSSAIYRYLPAIVNCKDAAGIYRYAFIMSLNVIVNRKYVIFDYRFETIHCKPTLLQFKSVKSVAEETKSLLKTARRFRWNVCTEWLFSHIVASRCVSSGAASAANLPVPADTTLTLKAATVTHPRKVFIIVPYIRKFLFEHIAAVYRQIPAGKNIPLMACEQHPQTC